MDRELGMCGEKEGSHINGGAKGLGQKVPRSRQGDPKEVEPLDCC